MNAARRRKLTVLQSQLDRVDTAEAKALERLRAVGWNFSTITEARRRLAAERTLAGHTPDHLLELLASGDITITRRTA